MEGAESVIGRHDDRAIGHGRLAENIFHGQFDACSRGKEERRYELLSSIG